MTKSPIEPGSVLRGPLASEEPRVLLQRSAQVPPPAQPLQPQSRPQTSQPPAPQEDPSRLGYKAGFEEGRREGWKAGIEEGRKAGLEKGLKEGLEQGRAEGLRLGELAREALDERIQTLDQWLAQLPPQWERRLKGAEEDLVALAFETVCRLLGDGALRREVVVQAVREALEQSAPGSAHAGLAAVQAIHVHPGDLELLKSDPEFAQWLGQERAAALPWVPDDQVQMGGCLIRAAQGSLDARLETQLRALKALFLQNREAAGAP